MELLKRFVLAVAVIAIILLAVVLGSMRLAISNIDFFESEIEYLFKRDQTRAIVFTELSGAMNRFNPILRIENVSVDLPDRTQPLFIDRLEVEFDFWSSLREWAPVALEISGQLDRLELVKDKNGRWWTSELSIGGGSQQEALPDFEQLLSLVPRYMKIDLQRLVVRDQQSATTHQLDRVSAHINHRSERFLMQMSAILPEQLGGGLLLKSIIGPERSLVYINSSDLQLNPVAELLDLNTWGLQDGALDGEIWINMSGYRVIAVNGNLVLKNGLLQVTPDKNPLGVDYQARFNAIDQGASWRITNEFDRLSIDDEYVPGFKTQLVVDGQRVISAWVDRLQLKSLPSVAGQWLPAGIDRQIRQGRLRGLLQDVLFRIDLDRSEDFKISATAIGLDSQVIGDIPGAQNLNAELLIGNKKYGARIYGEQVSLDFGDQFQAPFELDRLDLSAVASQHGQGLLVDVGEFHGRNPDVNLSGRMWMEIDATARPFMFLRANFTEAEGRSTAKYIPLKIMPDKIQAWLVRGIKRGFVPAGDLLYHGRLRDLRELTREKAGQFFVDFEIENADILFAPGWQQAKNGSGRVLFHNVGMEIDLDRGSYGNLGNARVKAAIENFSEAVLDLDIRAEIGAADAVATWIDTPVGKSFRDTMSHVHDLDGNVRTEIKIRLPLKAEGSPQVRAQVDFLDASAKSDDWGLDFSAINGRLVVTDKSLQASQIDARFFGDPVKIDIEPGATAGETLVRARGLLESGKLLTKLPAYVTRDIKGKSDWQLRLKFNGENAGPELPFLQINAASRLRQTAIALPQPVRKNADSSMRLAADVDFYPRQIQFKSSLGDSIVARGRLVEEPGGGYRVQALNLALATEYKPVNAPGVHVYGYLPELSLDDWNRIVDRAGGANPSILQSAQLKIDRVRAYNRILEGVDFELEQIDRQFQGFIESSLVKGSFQAPATPSVKNPVLVELEYLRLTRQEQESDYSNMRPGQLPDIRLTSKSLVYHDMPFSDLVVETRSSEDVYYVDRLDMRLEQLILNGQARWEYYPETGAHLSSVSTAIKGPKLGSAIARIGFGDTMRNGNLDFSGGFTWPAPLLAFSLDNIHGDARVQIENGVLNNVEPGGGRFVGLLSLSALPRRLSLDFSDVLIGGMEFDKIRGNYEIADGKLFTDNTRMDGPAATIRISGNTGIVTRDYEQEIRVTPKIRQTLPLIGAVSAGSGVGWGLLLLQNLFKKTIDKAVEVEYRVTGSWDDPKIELIKAVDENQREVPSMPNIEK